MNGQPRKGEIPKTEIRFGISAATHVMLKVYNTLGEEIRTLAEAQHEAGYHSVRWDGKDKNGQVVAGGVYLYQLQVADPANGGAGDFSQVKKMTLLR